MGLLMQKTTKLYLIIAILAVLSCSSYYILNESYGQTNEGAANQETPVLTPDSAGSVHTAVLPTQVSQAMQNDFNTIIIPEQQSVIYKFEYGTVFCPNGLNYTSPSHTPHKVLEGTWNSDTKIHDPYSNRFGNFHGSNTLYIFAGNVFDGKFHLHGIAEHHSKFDMCNNIIPLDTEDYFTVDVYGYCDGSEGTIIVNNGQYNITSTDAQFTAACTN